MESIETVVSPVFQSKESVPKPPLAGGENRSGRIISTEHMDNRVNLNE